MAWNFAITKQNQKKSDIPYMKLAFWDKVIYFTDEPVVQCDVKAIKNTSLHNDDNDVCK